MTCPNCGGDGVIMVGLDLYEKCKCQGERMAVNLVLDKCCKILNHEICSSRPRLESYTLGWNEATHYWQFDLKTRDRSEPLQLCHRTMMEQGEAMVDSFRGMVSEVLL